MTDPTALPDFPPPADQHPLRGVVLDILLDAGHQPDIDQDGDVSLRYQDQQVYVRCTEAEISVVRVFGQWRLGPEVPTDELTRLRACNAVTSRLAVAKLTLGDDMLMVCADHVVAPGSPLQLVVVSSLDLLLTAVNLWHETVAGGPVDGQPG